MPGARRKPKQARGHRVSPRKGKGLCRDLGKRTPGEELWCRRRWTGLTGLQAAEVLGVGRTALWLAEQDAGTAEAYLLRMRHAVIRLPQLLALARRRQGWGLLGTAKRVGVSHTTLLIREKAGDPGLMEFWVGEGFTFVRGGSL